MSVSRGTAVRTHNGKGNKKTPAASGGKKAADARDNNDLVSGLLERTRLLEAQFLHAQRMETFSSLLPGLVHDFNHLLTHIIGYTELSLANLSPGDRNEGNLEKVRESGKKAADLTRKLLSHCRRQDRKLEVLDISAMVENVGRLFHRILGENIQIEFDLAEAPRPVRADAVQVEQILMNLVVNARDAMPGGGRILFETRDVDLRAGNAPGLPPGRYVLVAVEDSGLGIPPEIRDRIFEPFFTTKVTGRGTGLGLSTVIHIVESHQGHVLVDSKPGEGSRFSIYLPVAHDGVHGEAERLPLVEMTGRPGARKRTRRDRLVLVRSEGVCGPVP